jgi:hypothetical protein
MPKMARKNCFQPNQYSLTIFHIPNFRALETFFPGHFGHRLFYSLLPLCLKNGVCADGVSNTSASWAAVVAKKSFSNTQSYFDPQ